MRYLKLWVALATVMLASFAVLGYYGVEIYRQAPPIPEQVVDQEGNVLFSGQDIRDGQNVWQSIGGQELGSIWGHGAYVAPDWSADWLHREAVLLLNTWAQRDHGQAWSDLSLEQQAVLKARLKSQIRTNTYDPESRQIVVSSDRAAAFRILGDYYGALFGNAETFPEASFDIVDGAMNPQELRDAYAVAVNTIRDPERQRQMNAFFFWAAWACGTERPQAAAGAADPTSTAPTPGAITYTNNWPPESLIDNRPSGSIILWSVISFVLLLAGIGALAWYYAVLKHKGEEDSPLPSMDPLLGLEPTPSMRATLKFFWVVAALIVVQVGLGAVTAHYGVEGSGFYGFPLADWLPYSVTRTWHTQLGIFWIATAWLATGLFMAPAVSGHEPKFQRAGVNFLFVCLLIIVVGSMFGTWYGTRQKMGFTMNFWFGHQGYEYVDLGRFWRIFLFIGLFLWLGLMLRGMWPAFKKPGEHKHLLGLFLISSA
ncbi:MAG: cbb3-type cytochrome c oxidase subunit I, partial [Verrucomicrobiota bacterium]|nr:cbb3-type cytochrome c oxidase subunit I [Verrucomicrobiota bacterium]